MIIKRSILLDASYDDIFVQLKASFSSISIQFNKFSLYKTAAPMRYHNMFRFYISGYVQQEKYQSKIDYVIRPSVVVILAAVFFAAGLMAALFSSFCQSLYFSRLILALAVNLIFWGLLIFQQWECMKHFEQKLGKS